MRITKKVLKVLTICFASLIIFVAGMIIFERNMGTVHAAQPVVINASNFPDPIFRSVIAETYDYNGDGYIDDNEVRMTMNISCEGKGIKSVKGIEFFTEIQGLWVKDNDIDYLDVSKNVHLHGIWCSGNNISSIDLTHNPELEWIYCYDCNLTSLDVSCNPEMSFIECNTNPITSLDVTHNPKLEHLTCGSCELTTLDLSNNPNLAHLDAFRNHFRSLDVSHNPKMKRLDIWDNPGLGSVDLSHNPGLQYYNCANNGATSVDVTHNPELTKLICSYNELTSLDVTHNPKLVYLDCAKNEIYSLDLSKNLQLRFLQAFINKFTTLDIGYNPLLVKTYNEGYKQWEYPACYGYSWTIDYGGDDSTGGDHIFFICFDDYVNLDTNLKRNLSEIYVEKNGNNPSKTEDLITREAFAWTLYNMAGCPAVDGLSSRFNDVESDAWYSDAVIWGEKNHICVGYPYISCDNFGVGKYISREDAVLMLMRYSEVMELKRAIDFGRSDDYIDYYDVDFDHWEAICWSATWNIMEGKGEAGAPKEEQRIDPFGKATRDECENMIKRLFEINSMPEPEKITIMDDSNLSEVRDFVSRFYSTILGREGEEKGIEYWTKILINKRQTGAQVASGFVYSPEFMNAHYPDDVIVEKMYYAFFGRQPDEAGYKYWMDKFIDGYTLEQVLSGFTDSQEFQNLCDKYGIERGALGEVQDYPLGRARQLKFGSKDNLDESKVEEYVVRMYQKALGRGCGQEEIDYWKNSIMTGTAPSGKPYDPASVASDGFLNSAEYIEKNKTDEEFVFDCYQAFFDRTPGTVETDYWIDRMKNRGYSRKRVVLEGFGTSNEFRNLLTAYGFEILE